MKKNFLGLSDRVQELGKQAEQALIPYFARIDEIAEYNTQKVLAAFQEFRVSDTMFAGTTGYGYDDHGRDTLEEIYARLFETESALVRLGFVNGTHALSCALFGALEPEDVMLSITSEPYNSIFFHCSRQILDLILHKSSIGPN